jgi:hypothetical protein
MKTVNLVMLAALGTLLAYACVGCPPHPQPVVPDSSQDASADAGAALPPTDAQDASTGALDAGDPDGGDLDAARYPACAKACATLGKLGCPEAATVDGGQSCYAVCGHAAETKKFDFKAPCLATAKTIADAKACGSVRCLLDGGH